MKLSVLVVTYNHEKYIAQCLDNILSQVVTFEYEIILCVDLCSDRTLSICQEYAKKHSQIKLLSTEESLGMVKNWKRALNSGNGDYIAICEGDDYWTNNSKLQEQVDVLDNNNDYGLCYTDCDIICENTEEEYLDIIKTGYSHLDESNPLKNWNYACNVTWVFRRDFIQYFKIEDNNKDIPLTILYEIYLRSKVKYVDINSGVYRRHNDSVSYDIKNRRKMYEHAKYTFNFFNEYIPKFEKAGNYELTKRYSYDLWTVYKDAKYFEDEEIIDKFEKFFEGKLNLKVFYEKLMAVDNANKIIADIKDTFSYKLGTFLTAPLRWIRRKIKGESI